MDFDNILRTPKFDLFKHFKQHVKNTDLCYCSLSVWL